MLYNIFLSFIINDDNLQYREGRNPEDVALINAHISVGVQDKPGILSRGLDSCINTSFQVLQ